MLFKQIINPNNFGKSTWLFLNTDENNETLINYFQQVKLWRENKIPQSPKETKINVACLTDRNGTTQHVRALQKILTLTLKQQKLYKEKKETYEAEGDETSFVLMENDEQTNLTLETYYKLNQLLKSANVQVNKQTAEIINNNTKQKVNNKLDVKNITNYCALKWNKWKIST